MSLREKLAGGFGLFALAGSALAEVPAAATTAITTLQTDALAMIDDAWPVIAAIVGAFLVIKVFKRVAGKV